MKNCQSKPVIKDWINKKLPIIFTAKLCLITAGMNPLFHAQASPYFSLSGFGSLVYSISDNEDVQYMRGLGGEGADANGSLKLDSRLGMQLDIKFNELFSTTFQGIVRQNRNSDVRIQSEWAYIRAQINDFFVFRAGRVADPLTMFSDVREVDYSHTSIRLPGELYGQSPVANIDGIDLTARYDAAIASAITRVFTGNKTFYYQDGTKAKLKNLLGVTIDIEKSFSRWRLGYAQADISVTSEIRSEAIEVFDVISTAYPALQPFADNVQLKILNLEFISLGLELDLRPWQITTEWLQLNASDMSSSTRSGHITISRQFNKLTPFLVFSKLKQIEQVNIPFSDIPALAELISEMEKAYSSKNQYSIALGFRWDFAPSLSMKMQIENIHRDALGATFQPATENAYDNNDDVKLLSFGLDFLF